MSVLYSYINQGWQSTIVTISSVKSLFQIAASAIRNSRFVSTEDLDCIAMASLSLVKFLDNHRLAHVILNVL